ncbi:MAG: haloacid dehalogenase-like hydrolase [Gammaproteobacteria bacterium]|nr:haloacid dehalogenase-like hydrolase [Gammaproteobacteria bacterium]
MSADASNTVALAVELDGTLVRSDLFLESMLALLRQNPFSVFSMLRWLLSGRAVLKRRISERVTVDPQVLPYLEEVLQYVRAEQAAGRHTVLATGSDQLLVQPVADYLGCFDAVMASDGKQNCSGRSKERQLTAAYGESGFDYIGNSVVDLPVWRGARFALLAARSDRCSRQLRERLQLERVFYYPAAGWPDWARQLHLRYWVGNVLVFAPLLLGPRNLEFLAWLAGLAAFMAFNLCSSGVLLGVDLLNLSLDRRHPVRCAGPLAAGRIYLITALLVAPLLLLGGLLLALPLAPAFALVLALYSLILACDAVWGTAPLLALSGFVVLCALRLVGGGAAASISPDYWLAALPL